MPPNSPLPTEFIDSIQDMLEVIYGPNSIPPGVDAKAIAETIPRKLIQDYFSDALDDGSEAMIKIEALVAKQVPAPVPGARAAAGAVAPNPAVATKLAVPEAVPPVTGPPVTGSAGVPTPEPPPVKQSMVDKLKALGGKASEKAKKAISGTLVGKAEIQAEAESAGVAARLAEEAGTPSPGGKPPPVVVKLPPEVQAAKAVEEWAPHGFAKEARGARDALDASMHRTLKSLLPDDVYRALEGRRLKGLRKLLFTGATDVPSTRALKDFVTTNLPKDFVPRGGLRQATGLKWEHLFANGAHAKETLDDLKTNVSMARRAVRGASDKELQKALDVVLEFMEKGGYDPREIAQVKKMGPSGIRAAGGPQRVAGALAARPKDAAMANFSDYVINKMTGGKKGFSTPITSGDVTEVLKAGAERRPPLGGASTAARLEPGLRVGAETTEELAKAGIRGMVGKGVGKLASTVRTGVLAGGKNLLKLLGPVGIAADAMLIGHQLWTANDEADRIRELGMSDAGIPEATPDVLRARVDQENALLQRRAVLAKYEPQLMDQIIAAMTEQQAPPARTTDSERTIGSAAFPIQPGGTKGLSRLQMDQMMRQFLTELDSGAY